jgi:hypothetical protein
MVGKLEIKVIFFDNETHNMWVFFLFENFDIDTLCCTKKKLIMKKISYD